MRYVLERDMSITIVGGVEHVSDPDITSKLTEGIVIQPAVQPTDLRVLIEHAPDSYPDYFELQQVPIVSDRFLSALKAAGVDNVVFYPVVLEELDRRIEGHSVMNIVGRVSSLDASRAQVTKFGRTIVRVQRLALTPDELNAPRMFRLHELRYLILVDEYVRKALIGQAGVVLNQAEGWSDTHLF